MAEDADLSEALKELGISESDIYAEADDQIESGLDKIANDVVSSWHGRAPVVTGEYVADIQVKKIVDKHGHPARRVGDYAPYAHIVEYGSEDTDEHMIRAKIAQEFGNKGKYLI